MLFWLQQIKKNPKYAPAETLKFCEFITKPQFILVVQEGAYKNLSNETWTFTKQHKFEKKTITSYQR